MSDNLKLEESLSALMDNEVDDLELRRILKELPNDSELEQKWDRYHLISAALKQEVHSTVPVDLLSGIRSQLGNEASLGELGAEFGEQSKEKTGFALPVGFRKFSQGMIAASVALGILYIANTVVTPVNNGVDMNSPFIVDINESNGVDSTFDVNTLPEFNGDFSVFENSHTVSYDGTDVLDVDGETAKSRLRQAVYQEFIRTNAQRNR